LVFNIIFQASSHLSPNPW